jgi:hypothetical protein
LEEEEKFAADERIYELGFRKEQAMIAAISFPMTPWLGDVNTQLSGI